MNGYFLKLPRDNFIPRIFATRGQNGEFSVDDTERHYIYVLKLSTGDKVELFLDDNDIYISEFIKLSKTKFTFTNLKKQENVEQFDFSIDLLFGVCAKDNLRDILDFGTQVGVRKFFPINFEHSVGKKSEPFLQKKGNLIIREAVRQSKSVNLPSLNPVIKLKKDLMNSIEILEDNYSTVIVADLNRNKDVELIKPSKGESVLIIIGPESGLSERDLKIINTKFLNNKTLTVSPIVMRTQIAVVGVINYIRGVFR